jgi:hypothetical protein
MKDDLLVSAANISVALLGMDSAMDDIPLRILCSVLLVLMHGGPTTAARS